MAMTPPGTAPPRRHVCVVTGSRAEFGLLRPVMHAVRQHPELLLSVVPAGSHLVLPGLTFREVQAEFDEYLAEGVPMQIAGKSTRFDDTQAVGAGLARFGRVFERLRPDWIVVLGDRIEAFAAASAACIGGLALAHIHGGDRAEGIADEAMRHAISKMAHLHLAATPASGARLVRMGEQPERVIVCGSPAIDGLAQVPQLDADAFDALGRPDVVVLLHPLGLPDDQEQQHAEAVLGGLTGGRVLVLHPNLDPGRAGILRAIEAWAPSHPEARHRAGMQVATHLPRAEFVGLLARLAAHGGVLVGNSSAGLIEAAALRLPVVDIGPRQNGRERCLNALHMDTPTPQGVVEAVAEARRLDRSAITHPYGDGRAGPTIAGHLARVDPRDPLVRRKVCAY